MIGNQAELNKVKRKPGYAVVATTEGLNLRSAPSLEASALALMPTGAHFAVTGRAAVGFVQGSFGGALGWAFAEYLSVQGHHLGASVAAGTAAVVAPPDGVNLRATGSLDGTVVSLMPQGAA